MWQEQLDYFWDGGRRLGLGFFDGDGGGRETAAHPQLTVVSARDDAFLPGSALVDIVDAVRWRSRIVFIDLAADHRFIRLTAPDGGQVVLELYSASDMTEGSEWRLLTILAPEPGVDDAIGLRVASLPGRGDLDQLAREKMASAGARLVWAIGQRRALAPAANALNPSSYIRLTPATQVYPLEQNRLTLEAKPYDLETAADTREAPFAIMQHWLAENGAPHAVVKLRLTESFEESATLLGRASVAMALRQRQRLANWTQVQKQAGEPVVDPLTFEDIRTATGEPTEHPDAAGSGEAVIVVNLLNLLLDHVSVAPEGVAARRTGGNRAGLTSGESIEIDFYGASLGDDVGLVSPSAAPGDLGVFPSDPGGSPFLRLLRVEGDGLVPRRINDDDPLLEEMLRRATGAARTPSGAAARVVAERASAQRNRRDKLIEGLNALLTRANAPERFDSAGKWEMFDPLLLTSFAARAALGPVPGGFAAYAADPSLAIALSRAGALSTAGVAPLSRDQRSAPSLLSRMLAALGLSGMAPIEANDDMDMMTQATLLQKLTTSSPDAAALRDARIRLSAGIAEWDETVRAARRLGDTSVVEVARSHFAANGDQETATALADYLAWRKAGNWLSAEDARVLAESITRAETESAEARARAEAAALTPPPEKPKGFFRRLFG